MSGGRLWQRKYLIMGSHKAHFLVHSSATDRKIAVGRFRKYIFVAQMAIYKQALKPDIMKNTLPSLLFACLALFITSTLSAQETSSLLANTDILSSENRTVKKVSNEREVLQSINQYLNEHLAVASEFLEYYNSDVEFTIAFEIDRNGILQHITTMESCKNPIASALIQELQKLERVNPIVQNGVAMAGQYLIPVHLKKS